jgi:phosphate-selective porin OprO/OprP
MKGKTVLMAGVAAIAFAASPAFAQNATLEQRVQALEAALAANQDKAADDHTRLSTLEQNFNYTTWTFDNGRPIINSGDGRFTMAIRLRFQADYAQFEQESSFAAQTPANAKDLGSGALFRRAYFGVEGKSFKDFWYEFRLNLGGSGNEGAELNLARIAYTGIPNFRINVGVIQPIFTSGDTTSSGQLMFIERPSIVNIAADAFGGSDARRGVELTWQKAYLFRYGDNLILSGAFTGANTATAHAVAPNGDEQSQILGRAVYRVWSDTFSNVSFGLSGAQILNSGGTGATPATITLQDRPGTRVDGSRLTSAAVAAQKAQMFGVDAGFNWENFYLAGEYHKYYVDRYASAPAGDPEFEGFYVEGSWFITGEFKPYNTTALNNEMGSWGAPKVISPFSMGDSWGAWELVARYSYVNLDWNAGAKGVAVPAGGVAGGKEQDIEFGINWYLNNNVRVMLHDQITNVDRKATAAPFGQAGQNFNTIMARIQFSN